jgi:hypothetical protein
MTWIYDDIYLVGKNAADSDIDVIEVSMDENPYLPKLEIAAYAASLSSDDKKARLEGKFIQLGGLVYKSFDPDIHVVDVQVPPLDWEWYASVDHGYNNPTAWLWHAVGPNGTAVTFAEHYESERTVDYHAATVHMRNGSFGRIPDYYVGDPALAQHNGVTGTTIFEEYAKYDIPIAPANNDVLSGINKVNQYLQLGGTGKPNWYITRNCVNLIQEMARLRWKTWASKRIASDRNKQDAINKKDDHACDSARYFFTFLPDLRPAGNMPDDLRLTLPNAPVGIDAFIPQFKKDWERKQEYTEWTMYEDAL